MIDYLVVGLGLAGVSFCERLALNEKSYKVVSDRSQSSSLVAGGLYNPVVLKRFTLAWNADGQLEKAIPFYKRLEGKFGTQLDYKVPVFRKFASVEEQNMWFEATDKKKLGKFLDGAVIENTYEGIDAPYGYGQVLHTGRIDVNTLVSLYGADLLQKEKLLEETFDFDQLQVHTDTIRYKEITARKIVFAEGFGLKNNPYFNYLPLQGNKGELLTIKAPALKLDTIIKSSVFIIPLGKDLYRVGATYERSDKSNEPTQKARQELQTKLHTFLKCDYEIVGQEAGIRPTVADRRPLVGVHPNYGHLYVLNGFGSRGVLIAPTVSEQLYRHIEHGETLPPEIDVHRFIKRYAAKVS